MRRWGAYAALILLGGVILLGASASDLLRSARDKVAWHIQTGAPDLPDVMVSMPDGIRLATDVYLPDEKGPAPVVLMRLPYGKRDYGEIRYWAGELTARGFAVVAQDMRGRHGSEGVFSTYANAGPDGAATLDWIVAQPWSNGKVGTLGCSALGESQFMLAAERHPAHRAMVPIAAGGASGGAEGRKTYFGAFEGGIFQLAAATGWFSTFGGKTPEHSGAYAVEDRPLAHLPIIEILGKIRPDPTDFEAFLREFENPAYWREMSYVAGDEPFETPALIIDTWHDPSIRGTMVLARTLRAAGAPVSMVIAAGTHCDYLNTDERMISDLRVAPQERFPFVEVIAAFFAHHLADGPAPELPYLTYYMLVEDRWRTASDWPPENANETRFLLSGAGRLETVPADITPGAHVFVSDPLDPVPTIGGLLCCTGDPEMRSGPVYQNALETRDDLLIYSSDPLAAPMLIAGPLTAELRVSVDTPDTDLVLRVMDVDPAGQALLVQEGALRLRYRDGLDAPKLAEPGEIYTVRIELRDIAYRLDAGHRLRLHVAGTSFPRLARNLNTGRANYAESEARPARIELHSEPDAPSALILHVLPE